MGGSSSQPRTDPPRSSINAFLIEEMYTSEFSESLQENIGKNPILTRQWVNESRPHQRRRRRQPATIKRGRFKPMIQHGNARKKDAFWCEVLAYIESKTKQEGRRTYDMVVGKCKTVRPAMVRFCEVYGNVMRMAQQSGTGDENYVKRAMIHYQDETGVPFKFRHCWDVLKDKSEDASINLNTTVANEDEVQKIRRPGGRDKARATAKNKGSKASGSSTMNDDALARLMVNEMTCAEVQQHDAFMELKMREVECREREIAATEYRAQQEDIKLYLQPYDHLTGDQRLTMDEIKAKIKAKYNLQY
nr:hypothetical protein [Tanacetum cinerariifolium]